MKKFVFTQVKLPIYNWYRRPVVELLFAALFDEPLVTNGALF